MALNSTDSLAIQYNNYTQLQTLTVCSVCVCVNNTTRPVLFVVQCRFLK